jgi:hypothetical protein
MYIKQLRVNMNVSTEVIDVSCATHEKENLSGLVKANEALVARLSLLEARMAELEAVANPVRKNEKHYQRILEERLSAKHLHIQGVGYTDLTTQDAHIEVKKWSDYHVVPGQLAKYNQAAPRARQCAYFFGPTPDKKRLALIRDLMAKFGIEMFSFDANDVPYAHVGVENAVSASVGDFVRERMQRSDGANLLWVTLFEHYNEWAKEKAIKSTPLKVELARHGVVYRNTTLNSGSFCGVKGWVLQQEEAP